MLTNMPETLKYTSAREDMLRFIPGNVKAVLDVGCATGNFGATLKSALGCIVCGVEPQKEAAALARQKLDWVYEGKFEDEIDFGKTLFDCIVFNDVLEHLVDPLAALQKAKTLLAHGGHVVASIPNVLYFGNVYRLLKTMDWRYEDVGIMDEGHLRFFTRKSILRMFTQCKYEIVTMQGINPIRRLEFYVLNMLLFNRLEDMKYLQYAVVARPIGRSCCCY